MVNTKFFPAPAISATVSIAGKDTDAEVVPAWVKEKGVIGMLQRVCFFGNARLVYHVFYLKSKHSGCGCTQFAG